MTITLYAAFTVVGLVVAGFGYLLVDARIKLQTLNRSVDDLIGAAAMGLDKLDGLLSLAGPLTEAPAIATGRLTGDVVEANLVIDGEVDAPPVIDGLAIPEPPTGPIRVVLDHVEDQTPTGEIAIPRINNHPMTKPIPAAELIARIHAEREGTK